jgi:peptide/nickel transport system substrate-binding protein
VKPTEFTVLYDSVEHHKFDASMAGLGCGTDPDLTANIFATGEARNDSQYSNKRVDELFVKGRHEFDRDKRAAIYGELDNLIWEDQPYTWLFYRNAYFGFNKKLRGYNFSPKGPFDFSPGFDAIYKATSAP